MILLNYRIPREGPVKLDTAYRRDGSKVGLSNTKEHIRPPSNYDIGQVFVLNEEVQRVESEYQQTETNHFGKPGEKPLEGLKEIAKHINYSERRLKDFIREGTIPHTRLINKRVWAYPSLLDEWMARRRKKQQ